MADNKTFTPGSGATFATDEIGGVDYPRVKQSIGADGTAVDVGVYKASSNFNRPANTTDYTANDAVANNTSAGSVTPLSWSISAGKGTITRVRIKKTDQTEASGTFRLWLFDTTLTPGAGDNASFTAPLTNSIGYVDVSVTNAGSDDAVGFTSTDIPFVAGTVYGLLQTLSALESANASGETYTVDLWYVAG